MTMILNMGGVPESGTTQVVYDSLLRVRRRYVNNRTVISFLVYNQILIYLADAIHTWTVPST